MKINLIEYFEQTVKRIPDKTAVISGTNKISFSDLHIKSLLIAQNIIALCNSTNKLIAVYLSKSTESIISDTGITYSGNIYMNLDVKTPIERIRNIINLIQPGLVITNDVHVSNITPIFPQNAKDLGIIKNSLLFRYFRNKEKKLYNISDTIGCMSHGNIEYVLKHNPEVIPQKLHILPKLDKKRRI